MLVTQYLLCVTLLVYLLLYGFLLDSEIWQWLNLILYVEEIMPTYAGWAWRSLLVSHSCNIKNLRGNTAVVYFLKSMESGLKIKCKGIHSVLFTYYFFSKWFKGFQESYVKLTKLGIQRIFLRVHRVDNVTHAKIQGLNTVIRHVVTTRQNLENRCTLCNKEWLPKKFTPPYYFPETILAWLKWSLWQTSCNWKYSQ